MAGDGPRIAEAYISIRAEKAASFNEDVRRAGREAGKSYEKEFDKEADKGFKAQQPKRTRQGREAGAQIGDAAGKEAGERTAKGISARLRDSRGRYSKDGETVGAGLGDGASKSFGSRFISGLKSTSARASKVLENDVYKGLNKGFKRGLVGVAGIGALAASVSSLGTVTAGTVGALVSLSGAVGLLPGVMTSAGIAAAALKIGVHDIGTALSDSSDPKKYAEALKKLAPAAQSFVKAIVKMKPELKDLRNQVQQGLFKGLDKQVSALGDRYLPILSRGLTGITKGFNKGAIEVGKFLDSARPSQQIAGIFKNTGVATSNLAASFKPLTKAFLDIATVGTGFLPQLSDGIGRAAERFASFTDRASKSGQLREYFQGGIDAVGDLGSAVKGVARIIGGIFKAGGGANTSVLETFAAVLNRVADQVGRPEFQTGLSHFFNSISEAGSKVGAVLPQVGDALIALEPTLSKLVTGSGTALASILTTASGAAKALAPTLNVLADAFGSLAPHAGAVVVSLLAIKGALLALRSAEKVAAFFELLPTRIDKVSTAAGKAKTKIGGFSGAMTGAGKAAAAFGAVLIAQEVFGQFTKGADVSEARVTALTGSLKKFQETGQGGAAVNSTFKDLGEQLAKASDPSTFRQFEDNLGKVQSKLTSLLTGGKSDGSGKGGFFSIDTGVSSKGGKEATALAAKLKETDTYLTSLVSGGKADQASALFESIQKSAVAGGAGVGELAASLPGFAAALHASGGAIDATSGKVLGLSGGLDELISKTAEYANKAIAARGSARDYEAALDAAQGAAKRNGKTLKDTTAAGRENAASLDAIAQSGLAYAQSILDNGGSEARFQNALKKTRSDLVATGQKFGLSKAAAERYATSILGIPKNVRTTIQQYGIGKAITSAKNLADRLSRIPRSVITLVRTDYLDTFASEVERDKATARRHADGGLISRSLGGPRQDNVPAWLSAGEFIVNARAVRQPGVEELLRAINYSNRLPRFASGGKVGAGFSDLTNSKPARIARSVASDVPVQQPVAPARLHPDDIAALGYVFERAMRQQRIYLDSGAIAGSVLKEAGRF